MANSDVHPNFVDLQGLTKRFGVFTALSDISLQVQKGEFLCFVGPSGCGKTTLLRMIAGLEEPDRGRVIQAGQDVTDWPVASRDFGIVFQSYALFPNMTVAANVSYGLKGQGLSRTSMAERVQEMLSLVGLPEQADKYPSQISGGQQQRVALARALAPAPGLLLLDEPLSALDAKERARLRQEIRDVQTRLGLTTIMVTHDQDEALQMADRIVVMNSGRIEQVGTPKRIYSKPETRFAAGFIGDMNWVRATSDGPGSVRLAGRRLDSQPHDIATSQLVDLALRPEDILVSAPDVDDDALPATLNDIRFRGSFAQCHLSLDDSGDTLVAHVPPHQASNEVISVGNSVGLRFRANRAVVFPISAD